MNFKSILAYCWKIPLCGIGFILGMTISKFVVPSLNILFPGIIEGYDVNTIVLWFLLGSMALAFLLSFFSRNLRSNGSVRLIILVELCWILGIIGIMIKSFLFMETGVFVSMIYILFTMFSFLLPIVFLAALVAVLFRPGQRLSYEPVG